MSEYDKTLVAEFLSEHWHRFVKFMADRGESETDAERILAELQDE